MPFGAALENDGGVRFALWAPGIDEVVLEDGPKSELVSRPMLKDAAGWHSVVAPEARAGDRYRFLLPRGLRVPDPASRFNPGDVHGPSQVVDPAAYSWRHGGWRGLPWRSAVVYEVHIGAFTPEGTFAAARARLKDLADLGITAVELMPVADFPGGRNWGYDGVLPFAPDASYGTPDDLKALIDEAHGLGMMMLLDVVYNHFGPEGNYLHSYCPQFFNSSHPTFWGPAINYDGADCRTVRDFFVHNALYWVEEFQFDGLRMDAIHAIRDDSQRHIVREIRDALSAGPGRDRYVHLVLENDANQASLLRRDEHGVPVSGTAQWNDDLHHAAHVLISGETDGYYADYSANPLARFGRALAEGFIYQGQPSPFREGAPRGEPCTHLPKAAFVSFLQTHDQVGNRAFGERIHALGDPALVRLACACVLLSPHTPMLFMGEEFAATTPFQFFCDFGPDLAAAVSRGRREEFARFASFADESARSGIPDPNALSTFLASRLRWEERETPPHDERLNDVKHLLALRRRLLLPLFSEQPAVGVFECEGETLRVSWRLGSRNADGPGPRLSLLAHFGAPRQGAAALPGTVIHSAGTESEDGGRMRLSPGAIQVTLEGIEGA